jgi:hypothetical protein
LIYLLDQYRAEHGTTLQPGERRQLKFEVEAWQLHLRDLEDRGQDILTSTPKLARIGTKEELADWLRKSEIGRYRPLGRVNAGITSVRAATAFPHRARSAVEDQLC